MKNAYITDITKQCPNMGAWDGQNSRRFPTSNRLIIAYRLTGENGRLNSVTLKQVNLYDNDRLTAVLSQGYCFLYQGRDYTLQTVKGRLTLTIEKGGKIESAYPSLTKTLIKTMLKDGVINKDITDVLSELVEKGIRG